jgi:dGTPase
MLPFGHNGEDALNNAAAQIGGFEGNAQSFRVLTRLESKAITDEGGSAGLNLTRASLDGVIKYPWPREPGNRKFNTYADDEVVFAWVRDQSPARRRCFEAQVMDWSDDVAYSVHDLEDGVHAGHIDLELAADDEQKQAVSQLAHDWYTPDIDVAELREALDRIQALPQWPRRFDGTSRDMVALKNLTSSLIGRFVQPSIDATRDAFGARPLQRYAADLIIPQDRRNEVVVLKSLANLFVFQRDDSTAVYQRQQEVIVELVDALVARAPEGLDALFAPTFQAATDEAARLRVIIDQVASLTDRSVIRWHTTLCR